VAQHGPYHYEVRRDSTTGWYALVHRPGGSESLAGPTNFMLAKATCVSHATETGF